MFEDLRDAFRELLRQRPDPDTRRDILGEMRETLVRARVGVDDLRRGVADVERQVTRERREVETVERRRVLAEGIGDAETVAVAERYAAHHRERLAVLERKLEAQRAELALVEREVETMTSEYRLASKGGVPGQVGAATGASPAGDAASELDDAAAAAPFDALDASRRRAAREAEADERLAELKRRMGR